jgi:hypothetical protein
VLINCPKKNPIDVTISGGQLQRNIYITMDA